MNPQEGHTVYQLVHKNPLRMRTTDIDRLKAFVSSVLPSERQGMSFHWDRTAQKVKKVDVHSGLRS
jgi:hypothetical protein